MYKLLNRRTDGQSNWTNDRKYIPQGNTTCCNNGDKQITETEAKRASTVMPHFYQDSNLGSNGECRMQT